MRWPSAYCAMSRGTSRSIMRSSTQPTLPEEFRTRYQSSMTGLGGSATISLDLSAALATDFAVDVAEAAGVFAAVCGPGAAWLGAGALPGCAGGGCFWSLPAGWPFAPEVAGLGGGGGLGAFLSVVARFRTSTFSPSLSW